MAIMEDAWYDIILDNWAQITVLIGAVGFVVQQLIQYWLKKREITFSRLQENKIMEIKAFYKSYQNLEIALRNYLDQTEYGTHEAKIFHDMKSRIRDLFIDFDYNVMTVKLFLPFEEIETVDNIRETLESIRKDISIWHVNKESRTPQKGTDKLNEIRDVRLPETLPTLIKRIENSLRKSLKLS